MELNKYTYLVIENAPAVCEGIIKRMKPFEEWCSLGYAMNVKDAHRIIREYHPHLLFLDWSLQGGSAYDILELCDNIVNYFPYVIFNTGYQKEHPEIPQYIFNNYHIDKYLIKPFWEDLRQNLYSYLENAKEKAANASFQRNKIWVVDINKIKTIIYTDQVTCICQDPVISKHKIIYSLFNNPVVISSQWHKIYEKLDSYNINYFITKSRGHLVVKNHIHKYIRPYVYLHELNFKIEVVKDNLKIFEEWLFSK